MSYEGEKQLMVNRLNGSLLTVQGGKCFDGARICSVRYATYDHYPQRWTTRKIGEVGGWTVCHVEISEGGETFRLAVDSDEPKISLASQPLLKEPDDSDRQKWCFRSDWSGGGAHLMNVAPYLNRSAGLGLRDDFGLEWTEAALVRNFSTIEQLWYFNAGDYKDSIPN
ncbi:hypothetical protein [Streptomyces sp. NPDC021212]|uniref:hypothetical protein n=1 Tax=Streptomyces sp. NPDC021212 TaxID=3365118 RepID=UPI00379DB2B2